MSQQTIDAYNRRASRYEQKWRTYLDHTHQAFLDRIEISPNDTLLDLSGGTGLLAKELVTGEFPFQKLIVNDPSEKMLEIARARLPESPSISFTNFRTDEISFDGQSIDVVFCLNAFHFYPDQLQVLENLHHILNPGGRLYLLDWNRAGLFRLVNRIIDWVSSDFIDTQSLSELREMMTEAGFDIPSSVSWNWQYWKFLFVEARK